MEKSVAGQMEDAYQECILNMLPAIKVSRELRRAYYDELSNKDDPQLKKKVWIFLRYKGIGIVPEDSPFWKNY